MSPHSAKKSLISSFETSRGKPAKKTWFFLLIRKLLKICLIQKASSIKVFKKMSQTPINSIYRQDRYAMLNSPGLKINRLGSDNNIRNQPYGQFPSSPGQPMSINPGMHQLKPPFANPDIGGPTSPLAQPTSFNLRDLGSPARNDFTQSRIGMVAQSQPRRVPTNHHQESLDGRQVTSTDSRNPLMMSFGESSREPAFSRGAAPRFGDSTADSKQLYSSPLVGGQRPAPYSQASITGSQEQSPLAFGSRPMPYSAPQGNRAGTNRGVQSQGREELELLRSKNKAFISVTKEKFPEFLSKIEKMSQTVHRNINHSFTSKLKDIWVSYINDQNNKNQAGKSVNSFLEDLKPIESASVEALNAQTDNLIKKIKLGQLEEIKKQLTNQNGEPELDMQSPLFSIESEYRYIRDKNLQLKSQFEAAIQDEERSYLDMRRKNHNAIQLHLESYKKEFQIKMANDSDIALEALQNGREFYATEIQRMRGDLQRNARRQEAITFKQSDRIADLESKVSALRSKIAAYQLVN